MPKFNVDIELKASGDMADDTITDRDKFAEKVRSALEEVLGDFWVLRSIQEPRVEIEIAVHYE
jgi:hypothetical protein